MQSYGDDNELGGMFSPPVLLGASHFSRNSECEL